MNTYTTVRDRTLHLLEERSMSIYKLAMESAVPPSSIKKSFTEKAKIPALPP